MALMAPAGAAGSMASPAVALPRARISGGMPLANALQARRSLRNYADTSLSLAQVSQLLWAAQGITSPRGLRTAPSAGGLYPLETYLVAGRVNGLEAGVYHYRPASHDLVMIKKGDVRANLAHACMSQPWVRAAPASVVFVAVRARMADVYHAHADRYIDMEIGHAGQNVYLQATSLGLGTVAVGAFDEDEVSGILNLPRGQEPRYVMPVGNPTL